MQACGPLAASASPGSQCGARASGRRGLDRPHYEANRCPQTEGTPHAKSANGYLCAGTRCDSFESRLDMRVFGPVAARTPPKRAIRHVVAIMALAIAYLCVTTIDAFAQRCQ